MPGDLRTDPPGPPDPSLADLIERVGRHDLDDQSRWELLLDAVVTLAQDHSLESLLQRVVVIAGALADARYAALGVLDPTGEQRLQTFVHHGFSPEEIEHMGRLPEGGGLLGHLIDVPEPLRLDDLSTHPSAQGFPAGHPAMRSFLGVPIRTRSRLFGSLYLTGKRSAAAFTADDERIMVALAAAAGVAIDNAQLLEETARRERWLAAAAQITGALLAPVGSADPLQLVADLAREAAGADAVWVVSETVPGRRDSLRVQAVGGMSFPLDSLRTTTSRHVVVRRVVDTGTATTVDDVETDPRTAWVHSIPGWPVLGPAVFVPMGAHGKTFGVLVLAWTRPRRHVAGELDPQLPALFAEQAALTLQLREAQETQHRLTVMRDRERIARDLHDVVIQRLFAAGLGLQSLARHAGTAAATETAARIELAVDELDAVIRDIRRTIFELGAQDRGRDLRAEITRVVDRAAGTLKFRPQLDIRGPVGGVVDAGTAADLLAVLIEALSNVARHAGAQAVSVVLTTADDVALRVTDDGQGMPTAVIESGLRNLRERAAARGGSCVVTRGPDGQGTSVLWRVPLVGGEGPLVP